jgi:hypothetical protein
MIKKKVVRLFFAAIVVAFLIFLSISPLPRDKKSAGYNVETYRSGDGWGYQISKDEKVIISQPYMPSVKGERSFPDEKSARDIGELVLFKLKQNINPAITNEEIKRNVQFVE